MLAVRLKSGRDAAFITEGDPMLYSTFLYVLEGLKVNHPGVPVEIVPGVSSVMAAAASAGTPLASHGESARHPARRLRHRGPAWGPRQSRHGGC